MVRKAKRKSKTIKMGIRRFVSWSDFIESQKKSLPSIFDPRVPIDWDSHIWNLGNTFSTSKGNDEFKNVFFTTAGSKQKKRSKAIHLCPYSQPYLDQVKALFTYAYSVRFFGNASTAYWSFFNILHIIYNTLGRHAREVSFDNLTPAILDSVAEEIRQTDLASSTKKLKINYVSGLVRLLKHCSLVRESFLWIMPRISTGTHGSIEERMKKMPHEDDLLAIPRAFHLAKRPKDRLIISIFALLMMAPSREGELWKLSHDFLNEDKVPSSNEPGKTTTRMSLNWRPSKGAGPVRKWIPSELNDHCKDIYTTIKSYTDEARRIAAWYEQNPSKLYLPTKLQHFRKKPKQYRHIAEFETLFAKMFYRLRNGRKNFKPEYIPVELRKKCKSKQELFHFRFCDVEEYILDNHLPKEFQLYRRTRKKEDLPYFDKSTKLKYSEALLVVPSGFTSVSKKPSVCMFEKLRHRTVIGCIHNIPSYRCKTLFQKLGIKRSDGSEINLKSHQLRHWLNTLAEMADISELLIALWSGRKDIHQNHVYKHESAESKLERFIINRHDGKHPLFLVNPPVTKVEWERMMERAPCHTTPFGYCRHNLTATPCPHVPVAGCNACSRHLWIKGLQAKEAEVRSWREQLKGELSKVEGYLNEEAQGADRWVASTRRQIEFIDGLLEIYEDKDVPDNSGISLDSKLDYQPLIESLERRIQTVPDEAENLNHLKTKMLEHIGADASRMRAELPGPVNMKKLEKYE